MNAPYDLPLAICAQRLEHLPKMAYADWLEEHGEAEEAAMIRQPSIGTLPNSLMATKYQFWRRRAKAQLAGIASPRRGCSSRRWMPSA